MRAPCSLLFLLLPLSACEPMDDPGSPWKPAAVSAAATGAAQAGLDPVDAASEVPQVDPMFDVPEPMVIHSSELGQVATEPEPDPIVQSELPVEPPQPEALPDPDPVELVAPQLPAHGFPQYSASAVGSWPLRLVATVPGAQPPRAILGLPGGAEVVVTPGTMLPDVGVVVMAIGSTSIDLAEVHPAGDHAVVRGRSLQAQRTQRIEIGAAQ